MKHFELSTAFSLYNGAVVLDSTEDEITFGLLDITDTLLQERLRRSVALFFDGSEKKGSCRFTPLSREQFERIVSLQYGKQGDGDTAETERTAQTAENHEQRAAIMLLDSLLENARARGATDIHIEERAVRFRVNGVLEHVCELAEERSRELVRRIKMLARLNPLERRGGQDGQFVAGERPLFVRVSCLSVLSGRGDGSCESVVLRLLDPERVPMDVAALGFSARQCDALHHFARSENGLVLICGATGSGKSTTAAALLSDIAEDGRRKIITIEEPPEYILDGVTQIAVDAAFGMDFERALRCIFRHDPDVIFIGEIRDEKTARTAVQAAMTGHLVFATLHTGGFYETLLRMQQLGADGKEVGAVLRGIIVQSLAFADGMPVLKAGVLRMDGTVFWTDSDSAPDIQRRLNEAVI